MTSVTVTQIKAALANAVTNFGVTYQGKLLRTQTYISGTIEPPIMLVVPGTFIPGDTVAAITYDATMGNGSHDYVFTLFTLLSDTVDRIAQDTADQYISAQGQNSIKAAIEADMSLGGVVHMARIQRCIQYGKVQFNGINFFGAQLVAEVTAT